MRKVAFTLVEVIAVIAVLGLLAGATAWSMADDVRQSSLNDAVDRVAHIDRSARAASIRFGQPGELVMDMQQQTLTRSLGRGFAVTEAHPVHIDGPATVDRVLILSHRRPIVERTEHDTARITYTAAGRSRSYAVRVSLGANHTWLLVAGLTGHVTRLDDLDDPQSLLNELASKSIQSH